MAFVLTQRKWLPQDEHAPAEQPPPVLSTGSSAFDFGRATKLGNWAESLLTRSAASRNEACWVAPAQQAPSPCAGTSSPSANARKGAPWHKKSTGFSASPLSSSPFAAHMLHSEVIRQFVQMVS